jgi:hypothetical protein
LLCANTALESRVAVPEFIAANRGDSTAYSCVIFNATDIRESIASAEERIFSPSEAAISVEIAIANAPAKVVAINDIDVGNTYECNAIHAEAPPWSEEVAGAAG